MAAKKIFTQIFIYFSKPLRLLYSLIIYEIVNFSFFALYSLLLLSFFALYSLLLLSFFLYLKSVPIYVIVHVLMRDERRKKEASKVKQTTRQSNTAHPWQSLVHIAGCGRADLQW